MGQIIRQLLHFVRVPNKDRDLQKLKRRDCLSLTNRPMCSDPNYKLGTSFISSGGMIEALVLFKNSLDENPKEVKIWTGYTVALINGEILYNARTALQQCRGMGSLEKIGLFRSWAFIDGL